MRMSSHLGVNAPIYTNPLPKGPGTLAFWELTE